jgi:quinol monooxygenase YgiN
MIFITAKFQVLPEHADAWPEISADFTAATRGEPGCLWFRDGEAGGAHVQSEHFKQAQEKLPPHLAATPKIVNFEVPQADWSELGELAVDR